MAPAVGLVPGMVGGEEIGGAEEDRPWGGGWVGGRGLLIGGAVVAMVDRCLLSFRCAFLGASR